MSVNNTVNSLTNTAIVQNADKAEQLPIARGISVGRCRIVSDAFALMFGNLDKSLGIVLKGRCSDYFLYADGSVVSYHDSWTIRSISLFPGLYDPIVSNVIEVFMACVDHWTALKNDQKFHRRAVGVEEFSQQFERICLVGEFVFVSLGKIEADPVNREKVAALLSQLLGKTPDTLSQSLKEIKPEAFFQQLKQVTIWRSEEQTSSALKPAILKIPAPLQVLDLSQLSPSDLCQREEPKKSFDPEKILVVRNFLKNDNRSTLDKLKSLLPILPIPKFLVPLINMFLSKGTNADVQVSLENGSLNLTTDIKVPALGIKKGTAVLSLPVTAQPAYDAVTKLHPFITDKLHQALSPLLSGEQQVGEIIKIISTLPSEMLNFAWSNGSAGIIITLPNGASLTLKMLLPTSKESATTDDILRTFLKSILNEENYAGIETLLSQDMIFNWNGSTSRFEIRFPRRLALCIKDISIDISNWALEKLIAAVGNNSRIILPKVIRGSINFKNPSIQFDKGTTFIVENALIPDITIDRISYNPAAEKLSLSLKTSSRVCNLFLKEDIEIDLKEGSTKQPLKKDPVVNFECVPIGTNKDAAIPETKFAATSKETVSVFESLKQLIKNSKKLEPLIEIFFADQTKLDINLLIKDSLAVSVDNLNIPKLGITGKAFLKIPTQLQEEKMPVTLHREIKKIIAMLVREMLQPESLEEIALFFDLVKLAKTLPNQNISMQWDGNISKATLFITLPGGMELTLELDVKEIQAEHDTLRTKLLEALNSSLYNNEYFSKSQLCRYKLLDILDTIGKHDSRRFQILQSEFLSNRGEPLDKDKEALRAEIENMPGTDFLRLMLPVVLGHHFEEFAAVIEPLLAKTFNFDWNGDTKKFKIELPKDQALYIQSMQFKRTSGLSRLLINPLMEMGESLTDECTISLPTAISGDVNFENASINFTEGTSIVQGKIGLRSVSFAKENMIDFGINLISKRTISIDRTTSMFEGAQIAIVEDDWNSLKVLKAIKLTFHSIFLPIIGISEMITETGAIIKETGAALYKYEI